MWAAPLAVVFGVWFWLAFSSGGYLPRQWLLGILAVGFFGLIVSSLVAYPRRPRQLSMVVLALFGAYAVVVAVSTVWAASVTRVWFEAGRTFGFVLVLALAMLFLTDPWGRRLFRYMIMAGALALVGVCVWRLWSSPDIAGMFFENRLTYPVSYPNNAAALFLVFFWPLIWLAAGKEERAPVRGAALGLAMGLLCLALMTQSRGAVWSLAISSIIVFIISPARIRTIIYLAVPAVLMVYEFPKLNRFWVEGPAAVGGPVAARTIVVGAVTAAFIGLIFALLERWFKVGPRVKVAIGTVVFLAAVGGAVYGSMTLTASAGGPFAWASQTWRVFTGAAQPSQSEDDGASRLTTISSSGRVGIWRVAWQEFAENPALGVGADNFIFGYNRSRTTELYKPQQAHSLELQVLGETGVLGGVFAIGGMLLTLGGMMWPRCVAGWRCARTTWLRRKRAKPDENGADSPSRLCNRRWGEQPVEYGWEMAIVAALVYWLVHASVDWLWQMAGVAIPMLLLLAAGLAAIDARAGIMWPRWNRWLRIKGELVGLQAAEDSSPKDEPDITEASMPSAAETDFFPVARRAEQHLKRREKRARRGERRSRNAALLQPQGLLSHTFRAGLITVSLGVIVVTGLSYLSIQYQNSALAIAKSDGARAAARAGSARWLQPADPTPYVTQAVIYTGAAAQAAASNAPDRAGAVLDNLALGIWSYRNAVASEPADWSLHYRTGVSAVNLLLATAYGTGQNLGISHEEVVSLLPGLEDWRELLLSQSQLPAVGQALDSLAIDEDSRYKAEYYRSLPLPELAQLAEESLSAAYERNPLAAEISAALALTLDLKASFASWNRQPAVPTNRATRDAEGRDVVSYSP